MTFQSILWDAGNPGEYAPEPACFKDLRLDRIIEAIVGDADEAYGLSRCFKTLPRFSATVRYRQAILKELAGINLRAAMESCSLEMRRMRACMDHSHALHVPDACRKWMLDAAVGYGNAVMALEAALSCEPCAAGLASLHAWLHAYVASEWFQVFLAESSALQAELESIRYAVEVGKDRVVVLSERQDASEDYAESLSALFGKLTGQPVRERLSFFTDLEMGLLETRVLAILARRHPDSFARLIAWCHRYAPGERLVPTFPDPVLLRFDQEIQFYLSVLSFSDDLERRGFRLSFPTVDGGPERGKTRQLAIRGGYDLALALREGISAKDLVPNDCVMEGPERQMILTGPNQGGKTTFARMLGQVLWLSALGCPVPCREASVWLCDGVFTHFSVEEDMEMQAGRLQEELRRLQPILGQVTPDSLVILNELFATTTTRDARVMGLEILDRLGKQDCFCLYVTHVGELAAENAMCASLVAGVREDDPDVRTFRITRRPADGYAGAHAIARKYQLDYRALKERLNA